MPTSKTRSASRKVVFQPAVHRAMQRGIHQIVGAVRPTLGPLPRNVAIHVLGYTDSGPKILDDGGEIARHIVSLPDANVDMGAKIARALLWGLQRQVGDGTATAAVILETVYDEGVRFLASGGNAMRLRSHLEDGVRLIVHQLNQQSRPIEGAEALTELATTLCFDPTLAKLLGEIFDIVGEFGRVEIREGRSRELEREYVEGMYWERGLVSRVLNPDPMKPRVELEDAAVLITDLPLEEPSEVYPALELCLRAEIPSLMIVSDNLSDRVIGFLQTNRDPERLQVIGVHTPGYGAEAQAAALADLVVLAGGRGFLKVMGDSVERVRLEELGRARRVWADQKNFGIVGGKGNPRLIRQHIGGLRRAHAAARLVPDRDRLRERIGKILGGSATLWVGANTEPEMEARVQRAKRAATTLRSAMMEGVVAGGGAALLACQPPLQERLDRATSVEETAAYRILLRAVEAPLRNIATNAGYDDREVMAKVRLARHGHAFDAMTGEVVDPEQAGLRDSAMVVKSAVFSAINTAALALTVDCLVHRELDEYEVSVPDPAVVKRL
jgi:chaperonin GroEL